MQIQEEVRHAPDLPRLTGIRAVAAVFVVYKHFGDALCSLFPTLSHLRFVYLAGPLGVDLFFVLSGFILSHNYLLSFRQRLTGNAYRKFLVARFARVYPIHIATLACLTLLVVVMAHFGRVVNPAHYTAKEWLLNVTLVQAWPGVASRSWNYPSWSISAEAFAYLLFPICASFVGIVRRPWLWCIAILSIFLVPAWLGWIPEGYPSNWALLRVSAEFFAGCFLYRVYRSGIKCPVPPGVSGSLALAIGLACSYLGFRICLAVPMFLLLIWALAERPDGFLAGPIAQYAGRVSYSLYMTHGVVQIVLSRALPAERYSGAGLPIRAGIFAIYVLLIVASAVAAYQLIEVPARRWILRVYAGKGRSSDVTRSQVLAAK